MANLIDKDTVLAEINQRIKDYKSHKIDDSYHDGLIFALEDLRDDFLNTLEVKEVDLDREMQAFALLYLEPLKISNSNIGISITMAQLYSCAKHFFELGLKAQKGE